MGKADQAFSRQAQIYDTTIGWRFVNPTMQAHSASIRCQKPRRTSRAIFYQPRRPGRVCAAQSAARCKSASPGRFRSEITPVVIPAGKGEPVTVVDDEHPRATTLETLTKLRRS